LLWQEIFERKVLAHVRASVADFVSKGQTVDALVLSGGCAMNAVLNEKIRQSLPQAISLFVGTY
jgi:predicted NodU family carbamoyl transferase